jgi:Flp pilus assembly protein TadG
MRTNSKPKERRKGIVVILLSLMVWSILLPMVGLAIDLSVLYLARVKLQGAVDGACLAAARSLNGSLTLDSQKDRIKKIAQQFLSANYPNRFWGSNGAQLDGDVDVHQDDGSKRVVVYMHAHSDVPLMFLRVLYQDEARVASEAQAVRRYVRMVLVLDRSRSMLGTPVATLRSAARKFVNEGFFESTDQLGLVVFGVSAIVAYPMRDPNVEGGGGNGPDNHFKTSSPNMDTLIANMNSGSATGSAEAIWLAYQELKKNEQPLFLNLIVFFTDGIPNGITGYFNNPSGTLVKTSYPHCTYVTPTADPATRIIGTYGGDGQFNPGGTGRQFGVTLMMQRKAYSTVSRSADVLGWMSNGDYDMNNVIAAPARNGCYFASNEYQAYRDFTSYPTTDYYGNRLNSNDYLNSVGYHDHHVALNLTNLNDSYQIGAASWNAVMDAARRARSDATLKPVIFTLGYNGSTSIDRSLLKRMANTDRDFATWAQDPQGQYLSSDYDPNSTTGRYFEAPTVASINNVFELVQAEILKLTM